MRQSSLLKKFCIFSLRHKVRTAYFMTPSPLPLRSVLLPSATSANGRPHPQRGRLRFYTFFSSLRDGGSTARNYLIFFKLITFDNKNTKALFACCKASVLLSDSACVPEQKAKLLLYFFSAVNHFDNFTSPLCNAVAPVRHISRIQ